MAIITKIREKAGLAIGVVAVAMALFILGGDLLSRNSLLLGSNTRYVGSIGGKKITYEEFGREVERLEQVFAAVGRPVSDEQTRQEIRRMVWETMIEKYAYGSEFEKLGIVITNDELADLIKGPNMHPNMRMLFKQFTGDTTDGDPDKQKINAILSQMNQLPPQAQVYYYYMKDNIKSERPKTKYFKLLETTNFITTAEAKREYEAQNSKAQAKILSIPYTAVPDSLIKIQESQLREYYKKNHKKFKINANVELEYLTFPALPSPEDEQAILKEAKQLAADFAEAEDDTAFVEAHSIADNKFMTLTPANIPGELDFGSLKVDSVYGPYRVGDRYRTYKTLGTVEDTSGFVRASHILFNTQLYVGNQKAEDSVKKVAMDVLKKLQAGADFAQMARQYGSDGTKDKGGDLGWFGKNRMVLEFERACFKATKPGLIPQLVKTQFGYHIIYINNTKTTKTYTAAILETKIEALEKSRDKAYRLAGRFSIYDTYDQLAQAVKADSTKPILMQALRVGKDAQYINNLTGPRVRDVIRWAYEEAKPGDVSRTIYDFDNNFVVVALRSRTKEDEINLDAVREEVKADLMRKLKADFILSKLGKTEGADLEALKNKFGQGATIEPVGDISFNSFNITGVGFAPKLIGAIWKVGAGKITPPVIEESGVYFAQVESLTKPGETADYGLYKSQLRQRRIAQTNYKAQQAILKYKEVSDQTYNY